MALAVLGDSQATAAAGLAAAETGETVRLALTPTGSGHTATSGHTGVAGIRTGAIDVVADPAPTADAFLVVSTHLGLRAVIETHRERLAGRQVLLAPGGFAGVLRVARWFDEWDLPRPILGEATGFPVMGSGAEGLITVTGTKDRLPLAGVDEVASKELLTGFQPYFPNLVASDLVTTSLSNTNHMVHPAISLLNGVRIARGEGFTFYREGLTPELSRVLEAADAERVAVVRALGGEPLTVLDWMLRFYGHQGMQGDTIVDCLLSYAPFDTSPAPTTLDYRYFTDDVPYGTGAHAALAAALGRPAPILTAVNTLAATFLGESLDTPAELVEEFLTLTRGAHPAPSPDHQAAASERKQ